MLNNKQNIKCYCSLIKHYNESKKFITCSLKFKEKKEEIKGVEKIAKHILNKMIISSLDFKAKTNIFISLKKYVQYLYLTGISIFFKSISTSLFTGGTFY